MSVANVVIIGQFLFKSSAMNDISQNTGLSNHKLKFVLKWTVWSKMHVRPERTDRRTNIMAIAWRFVLTKRTHLALKTNKQFMGCGFQLAWKCLLTPTFGWFWVIWPAKRVRSGRSMFCLWSLSIVDLCT